VVRVRRGDPARLSSAVTAAIHSVDRRAAVTRVKPMSDVIADSVRRQRCFLSLIGAFASIAVLLSLAGLHGVLSYAVAQRTRALGIRAALGRAPLRTAASVVRGGIALIGAGVTCGLLCSALFTRLLQSILYGVSPLDTTTWLVATLVLTAAGMVAIVLPSFRAARIDPMTAMRTE
jgi:putative ABC transport system permease protein